MDSKRLVITLCLVHALHSICAFAARDPCSIHKKNCYSTESNATCIAEKQQIKKIIDGLCCCPCSKNLCSINGVQCHECVSEDSSTPALEELKTIAQLDAKEPTAEKPELKEPDTEKPGVDEGAVVTPDIKESDFDNPTVEEPDLTPTPVTGETDTADVDAGGIEEEEIRPATKPPVVSVVPTKPATKESTGCTVIIAILSIAIVVLFSILVIFCIKPELREQIIDKLSCCCLSSANSSDHQQPQPGDTDQQPGEDVPLNSDEGDVENQTSASRQCRCC